MHSSHNSQSHRWIGLIFYEDSPDILSYLGLNFQVNQSSERNNNTCQQRVYEFCYLHFLTCGLLIWLGFFFYKDVKTDFGNFLVPQGSLMSCNIISKCSKNSLMFHNLFLIRIPYSS
jgi:hypothetical protein